MDMNDHQAHCEVWDWTNQHRTLNNAKTCTCGFREQVAEEQRLLRVRNRALRPLGMPEADWLRTLGIDPEVDR